MKTAATLLLLLFLPVPALAGGGTTTARGTLFEQRSGDLLVTWLTGRDADATTPVFDMSVGDITIRNTGNRPVRLGYDFYQTGYAGHRFDFGGPGQNTYLAPRTEVYDPPSGIDYTLPPGRSIGISRRDLMDLFHTLGRDGFHDGTICASFAAVILVDGQARPLAFGPHCFRIAMARDWPVEQQRYLDFFVERDKRASPGTP